MSLATSSFLRTIIKAVESHLGQRLPRFRRGTVVGQSGNPLKVLVSPSGEQGVADGFEYPVLRSYTSVTVDDPGGPHEGDDLLILETTPNNPVLLGQLLTGPNDKANRDSYPGIDKVSITQNDAKKLRAHAIVIDHVPPVDGDVPATARDGMPVVSTYDNSLWVRSSGVWKRVSIPVGGTTGQALAKASNTDYDVSWQTISGGGGGGGGGVGVTIIEDVLAAGVNLPTAGVQVQVCSISVPAGTWIIMANVLAMQNVTHSTFISEQSGGGTPNVYFDMHVEAVSSSLYQEETVYQNDAASPIAMSIAMKVTLPVADTISLWVDCQYADGLVLANHNQTNLLAVGGSAAGAAGVAFLATDYSHSIVAGDITGGRAFGLMTWLTPDGSNHDFDTGGYFNPANPSRLTVPSDGIYEISGQIEFVADPGKASFMPVVQLNKNGIAIAGFDLIVNAKGNFADGGANVYAVTVPIQISQQCLAGDYWEMEWFIFGPVVGQNVGAEGDGDWFTIKQIG